MSTMTPRSRRKGVLLELDDKIAALDVTMDSFYVDASAKVVFSSARALLSMIRVYFPRRMTLSFRFTHI